MRERKIGSPPLPVCMNPPSLLSRLVSKGFLGMC